MICGLWLTLVRTPFSSRKKEITDTSSFLINEQIVASQKRIYDSITKNDSLESNSKKLSKQIIRVCEKIKSSIILKETGMSKISTDFETKLEFISDANFRFLSTPNKDVDSLLEFIKTYDLTLNSTPNKSKLPVCYHSNSEEKIPFFVGNNLTVLTQLQQIELIVMQNEM